MLNFPILDNPEKLRLISTTDLWLVDMPYVRAIVRGKASADVEFGAKVAISTVNEFCFVEHLSFDAVAIREL